MLNHQFQNLFQEPILDQSENKNIKENVMNLRFSRNSLLKDAKLSLILPKLKVFKTEPDSCTNHKKFKLYSDINSVISKMELNDANLNNSVENHDSLLNTHKNYVVFQKYREFNQGVSVIELKKQAFIEKMKSFLNKKESPLSYREKHVIKIDRNNTNKNNNKDRENKSVSKLFNSEINLTKKSTLKLKDLPRNNYNSSILSSSEIKESKIKLKREEDGIYLNTSDIKLPFLKVRVLDHKELPKMKNSSLLNEEERKKLFIFCKMKKREFKN